MSTEMAVKTADINHMVGFRVGKEEFGVDILKVREIIRMVDITQIPSAPDFVEGIINLRGKVIPIIAMRKRFGLGQADASNHTRIMVMDLDDKLIGFIVDSVSEVIRISSEEIQPAPSVVIGMAEQDCIAGVINHAERLLVALDLERMFSNAENGNWGEV